MTQQQVDIIATITKQLTAAVKAPDDDAWLAAMTTIRDIAWEGKALILDKRWITRPRQPLTTKPHRVQLDVSTLEDMLK